MRFLSFLLVGFSFQALAERTITSQIHDVDFGSHPGDEILVFLKSGDVVRLPTWEQDRIEEFQKSVAKKNWFTFNVDDEQTIVGAEKALPPVEPVNHKEFHSLLEVNYVPTTVESMEKATQYIRTSRQSPNSESQCFNRAMVWTYEWWRKHSLRSNKILIFWSKDYVRRYGFKWWFHIAPYVHVMDNDGKVVERVLDVKYISRPMEFQKWGDYHSKVDAKCKVVTRYSDYANYPYGHDCYFYRTHMYTYQPADLQMYEAWNYNKDAFNMDEVRAAYKEAFFMDL